MRIGIIGGGNVGGNLGNLLHDAGHQVCAGMREGGQARPDARYAVGTVAEALLDSALVVLALPYSACAAALPPLADALAGQIVVDATNPLQADWSPLSLGADSSAAEEISRLLPRSHVVKAFNTIFADVMTHERLDRGGQAVTVFVAGSHGRRRGSDRLPSRALSDDHRGPGHPRR